MDKSQPCDATMSIAGIHYSMCLHTALCVWVRACVFVVEGEGGPHNDRRLF